MENSAKQGVIVNIPLTASMQCNPTVVLTDWKDAQGVADTQGLKF